MVAGPNGAGKTTTALSLIPDLLMIYEFINADEIARGLSPLHPENVSLSEGRNLQKRCRFALVCLWSLKKMAKSLRSSPNTST